MGIDEYNFIIFTELRADQVLELMFKELGVEPNIKKRVVRPWTFFEQDWQDLLEFSALTIPNGMLDGLLEPLCQLLAITNQLETHVMVDIQILEKWNLYEKCMLEMVRAIGAILRKVEGDSVWLMDYHYIPGLLRKENVVTIDPSIWSWSEEEMQALGIPFVIGSLPYNRNI